MDLKEARILKQQILAQLLPELTKPSTISALGITARAVSGPAIPNSLALGISKREGNTFVIAVRVQASPLMQSEYINRIRNQAGENVDVRYIGQVAKLQALPQQGRNRPLRIGCSIGHFQITAGTLGCFVQSRTGQGRTMILSNNHVLANENRANIGDPIIQPGTFDGGSLPFDTVANLVNFEPLNTARSNIVDCAVAELVNGVEFVPGAIDGIGALGGVSTSPVNEGDIVRKTGRTTGTSTGRVTAFELDNVVVGYDIGNLQFDNQIEVEGAGADPFSRGGDSGSLVVNNEGMAIGLLFAGSNTGGVNGFGLTYVNPISDVLNSLNVDLVTGP